MGEPIEHEHTKDHKLAMDIALQHLDEFPDYYTRLKKMEASAKKEHKKFKDVTEGKGLWANIRAKKRRGERPAKPGEKGYPKTLDIEEGLKQARKNVGASKCWPGKVATGTKMKDGEEVPDCRPIKEESGMVRYCPKCAKDETKSECKYGPKYWEMYSLPSSLSSVAMSNPNYHANSPHPGNMPEGYDHEHSMARSELSTIVSAAKRLRKKMKGEGNIEAWVQSKITKAADYLDAAADYVDSGEMKTEEYSNWRGDFGLSEDWQKVNRKDKTDGLSQAAVNAYRKENPGSKLQTAVTEKKPKGKRADRRSNFCSRMSGMKSKLTSAKTARDPDSRINKALRRWNCN